MCDGGSQETVEEFVNALQVFVLELEGRQRAEDMASGEQESNRRLLDAARALTALLQRTRDQ